MQHQLGMHLTGSGGDVTLQVQSAALAVAMWLLLYPDYELRVSVQPLNSIQSTHRQ